VQPIPHRWNREVAARLLDEANQSGLSLAAFARSRGLDVTRRRNWRAPFARENTAPRLVELVPQDTAYGARGGAAAVRVHCPSGHVVEVEGAGLVDVLRAIWVATC
jgi:hypothetical protein